MWTNELAGFAVGVNEFHSLMGTMVYEDGSLGLLVYCNPAGWKAQDFHNESYEIPSIRKNRSYALPEGHDGGGQMGHE